MSSGVTNRWRPIWWLALGLVLSAPGCVCPSRRPLPPALPQPEEAAAVGAAHRLPEGVQSDKPKRLVVDSAKVADLQSQEMANQHADEDDGIVRRRCRWSNWLDGWHDRMYRRMDNAVRRVDTLWLTEENQPYDYQLSTFKIRLLARYGGRSQDGDSDFKVKFRADTAVPGLGNKLHLYASNIERDALPGKDPSTLNDDFQVGLRALLKTMRHLPLDLGAGIRLHSWEPVPYAEVEWRGERALGPGRLRLIPRGFWNSDDGLGQKISLSWTWPVSKRKYLQLRTAERSTETTDGFELEETFRFAWLRAGLKRGWVMQASAFPHGKHSDWVMDDYLLNITWRGAFYRKWIYYTITPQLEFPQEDDYEIRPSVRFGLEFLFGGTLGDLI